MKILQKILMIVMVGVVVGNVDVEGMLAPPPVTVLDLPAETPGLQNEGRAINHDGINCIHVIVPKTLADEVAKASGRQNHYGGNIYFPKDGHQPMTEQAIKWSGANAGTHMTLEQRLASPVTEWYIERFKSIIKFQTSEEKKEVFWNMFREIASDPVGRILLYRLLIEIYRVDIRGAGCTEKPYQMHENRNKLRELTVRYAQYEWYFNYADSVLSFNTEPYSEYATKVCFADDGRLRTKLGTTPMCVYLFHEMLHWFHKLHDYKRNKSAKFGDTCKLLGFYFKGDCYYDPTEFPQIWSGAAFGSFSGKRDTIDLEEVATILGVGDTHGFASLASALLYDTYENGDELSENLFSCSLTEHSGGKTRAAMRFGHALLPVGTQYDLIIKKAHRDTVGTMKKITGKDIKCWNLLPGQALLGDKEIINLAIVVDSARKMVDSINRAKPDLAAFQEAFFEAVTAYLRKMW